MFFSDLLKHLQDSGLYMVEKKLIPGFFALQHSCQWRLGGEEYDGPALYRLFAHAGGDKEGGVLTFDKSAGCGGRINSIGIYGMQRGKLLYLLSQLPGMHVFLQMTHGPGGFIFVACRAFLFLVSSLLRLFDGLLCRGYPVPDEGQGGLFQFGLEKYFGSDHTFTFITTFFTTTGWRVNTSG